MGVPQTWAKRIIIPLAFCRTGACLGIPCIIDLHDVDVLVPSPYEVTPGSNPVEWQTADIPPYGPIVEQLKLAILLGRVLKTIYR